MVNAERRRRLREPRQPTLSLLPWSVGTTVHLHPVQTIYRHGGASVLRLLIRCVSHHSSSRLAPPDSVCSPVSAGNTRGALMCLRT